MNGLAPRRAASPLSAGRHLTVAELAATEGLALLRFAYVLCGDRHLAEDLLQDVLAAMYRRFPDALPLDNPTAYARKALVNANISRARARSSTELPVMAVPDTPVQDADDPSARDLLWQALRRLPERQRTVLVLRFYADMTDADIATAIGARRGTVRSLLSRSLASLRTDTTLTFEGMDR